MDKSEILKISKKYAMAVKKKFDCFNIILFGSFAKGTNHEDSDIDIAVVIKNFDNLTNTQVELMRIRRKIDSRIEPHPFRLDDFNYSNPVATEVLKYGIDL